MPKSWLLCASRRVEAGRSCVGRSFRSVAKSDVMQKADVRKKREYVRVVPKPDLGVVGRLDHLIGIMPSFTLNADIATALQRT